MDKDTRKLIEDVGKITGYDYFKRDESTEDKLFCALRDLLAEYDNLTDAYDDLYQENLEYQRHSHNYYW